ncbi:putative rhamnosyltransferase [Terracoccus luteus]|uniref:Putative rhamnosyltransferase n=1 Tax=Terracoccus luteus TaxID=53356 RepID=A0A495XV92_9MICO|nr:glycosyltransferase [Terracoccus luteus]RKT78491.1 putative rhamnosyltransferase [Terracoccus luteus]
MTTQVLLTRYNLPSPGVESLIRARDGWLRERTELFLRYTVPSVRAQTCRDFSWLVYLDPESPAWLVELMSSLEAESLLTPLYRTSVPPDELVADLRAVAGDDDGGLITTNLDNDDGLARDLVERLRAAHVPGSPAAVYVDHGVILSGDALYLRRDRENAFCSVAEDLTAPVTCWADWHNRLHLHLPVRHLGGPPGWLQVIHGTNVSNRVRGRRVGRRRYESAFGGLLDQVSEPSATTLGRDLLVGWPYRTVRDVGRSTLREAIVRVGGKEGLDRLKDRLAARSTAG